MIIRKANVRDLERINEIYLEGVIEEIQTQFPKRSKLSITREMNKSKKKRLNNFKKEFSSLKNYWIVAEIKGKIIGFGNADIQNKKEGALRMIYVDKTFRRKGVGKALTKERIKWLKNKKIKKIYAWILINNKKSIDNLKKFGFEKTLVRLQKKIELNIKNNKKRNQ